MKTTKFLLSYIAGFFFGYLLAIFTNGDSVNNYPNFWPQFWFICKVCVGLLGIAIIVDLFIMGLKKVSKVAASRFLKFKNSYQKERNADFSPSICQNKNIKYLKINYPIDIFMPIVVTCSLELLMTRYQITKPKSKNELYHDIIMKTLNLNSIKTSIFFNFSSIKVKKGHFAKIPLFEIDSQEGIFYLFRKTGKPKQFFNNEIIPKLDEMFFEYGKYDFETKILARNFFGRPFVQTFSFPINYSEKGLKIEKNKIDITK